MDYYSILQKTPLFASIAQKELASTLECLGADIAPIPKSGFALMAGDAVEHIGIVLEGQLQITREDIDGVKILIAVLEQGDLYGEALSCACVEESPVNVVAAMPSEVMRLQFRRILTTCPRACSVHHRIIQNMVGIIAKKNIILQSRLEILSKKSIREKLMLYLSGQQHGRKFSIPLDRNELAQYLAVDRSALSREMSRLQKEGLISFHKNTFEILSR